MNWLRPRHYSWHEIDGFEIVRSGSGRLVAARLQGGRVIRIGATGGAGVAQRKRERIVTELELMREARVGGTDPALAAVLAKWSAGTQRGLSSS